MNNKQRKTVQQAYEDSMYDISILMDWLEIELDKKPEEIKWLDVGSLDKVRDDLLEILAFKSGCDIETLKETLEESRLDRPDRQQPIEKSKESDAYNEIKTYLKELEGNIAKCQRNCQQQAERNNPKMAQMYEKDGKDLKDILDCVNVGNFKQAWHLSQWVDTAVRDEIPAGLYNFLAKKNGHV